MSNDPEQLFETNIANQVFDMFEEEGVSEESALSILVGMTVHLLSSTIADEHIEEMTARTCVTIQTGVAQNIVASGERTVH